MVDREKEKARLEQAAAQAPQLVVLRGRRRVGKSYLLDHSFADRRFVYFQADEGEERDHLDLLAAEVGALVNAPLSFTSWEAALSYLGSLAEDAPLVVALDEYQWMRKAQPRLDSMIVRHFDRWERAGLRLTLVLSGSALTLMEELLEGNQPMFGRAAYRPLLEPFDFRDAAEFGSGRLSAEEKLRRFAVLGGTAQYQVWAGRGALKQILAERILTRGESLFEEPLQLIRGEDEIREPGSYYALLRAVAGGATRFAEIESKSKITSSSLLTKRLARLSQLRYLEERRPVGGNGRPVWALADPYFAFWFRYVYPHRSALQRGRVQETLRAILSDLDNFMGPTFERVCREWASRYARAPELAEADEIGAYWTRTHDAEIDLVARLKERYTAVGSCKWSTSADTHDLDRLLELRGAMRSAGDASVWLFARGFHPVLRRRAARDGVHLVSVDDLFA
jgi:AAA+ ATPase superfamily predicted ATPase